MPALEVRDIGMPAEARSRGSRGEGVGRGGAVNVGGCACAQEPRQVAVWVPAGSREAQQQDVAPTGMCLHQGGGTGGGTCWGGERSGGGGRVGQWGRTARQGEGRLRARHRGVGVGPAGEWGRVGLDCLRTIGNDGIPQEGAFPREGQCFAWPASGGERDLKQGRSGAGKWGAVQGLLSQLLGYAWCWP